MPNTYPTIEVELRSFVDDQLFEALIERFSREGQFIHEEEQTTVYYDAPCDLRIRSSKTHGKLILKKGELHTAVREEIEVDFETHDTAKIDSILQTLGFPVLMKWIRTRRTYHWLGVTATLDDTRGYGKIVELERLVSPNIANVTRQELDQLMVKLGLTPTTKEELDARIAAYQQNWRVLSQLESANE